MKTGDFRGETVTVRQPFEAWSIAIPSTFAEAFIDEGGYWHAYDEERSVSLTSVILTEDGEPVPKQSIVDQLSLAAPPDRVPVEEIPPGLAGWAFEADAVQPARASQTVSGMVATDGRLLIVTITSDDLAWARRTWLSIRAHAAPLAQTGTRTPERAQIH